MVELTVQLPEDVAARLAPIHERLPVLLRQIAQSVPQDRLAESSTRPATDFPVYAEVLDFLVTSPTPEAIVDFKVSASIQARLRELLEKNQEDVLSEEEQAELDAYEQIDHLVTLLKARAHSQIRRQSTAQPDE